jgi:hypothetical protein
MNRDVTNIQLLRWGWPVKSIKITGSTHSMAAWKKQRLVAKTSRV